MIPVTPDCRDHRVSDIEAPSFGFVDAQVHPGSLPASTSGNAGRIPNHWLALMNNILGPTGFVWGFWCLLFVGSWFYIAKFGSSVPRWDDWALVDMVTGRKPLWLDLWHAHNEHHVPLPKLIQTLVIRACGGDFRAGMFFNDACLGGLAAAMILLVRRLRGTTLYADAFFPMVCLNLGQDILRAFALNLFFSTLLALVVLLCILEVGRQSSWKRLTLMGISIMLLPLCGANGASLTPALAIWLAYYGWKCLGKRMGRAQCAASLVMAITAFALVIAYAKGYRQVHPRPPSWSSVLDTALKSASIGMGRSIISDHWQVGRLIFGILLIPTITLVLARICFHPSRRFQALGFLAFLTACTFLALAIGWGRASLGSDVGFSARYITLALPLVCCVYFVWGASAAPPLNHSMQSCLFVIASFLFLPNLQDAITSAKIERECTKCFEQDVRAGMSARWLAERYDKTMFPNRVMLSEWIETLHKSRLGLFRYVSSDSAS
jgi:hypothetical protein